MSRTRTLVNGLIILVFAVACIVGMEYLAINIGQPKPIIHGYRVRAVFANADGIPTAADVRVAGIVVGKVVGVGSDPLYPGQTVVTMEIDDPRADPVYANGFAKIRPKTLLGEKYVDLTVGSSAAEPLPDMGILPPARTAKDVSNDEIFNAFDAKTRQQQREVLQALDAATQQRAGDVQAILPQLDVVVRNLDPVARVYAKDDPQVNDILQNLDTVLRALADEHQQLAGLLANGNVALGAIAQRDQSLIATLREYSNVATELSSAIAPTVDAQRSAIAKLAPTLDSERAFVSAVLDPQPGCNNQPCGIEKVFTGTLLGQIYYPADQLSVTSEAGEMTTKEWASMFSFPTDQYHNNGTSHSSLNISLAFHCDTVTATLQQLIGNQQIQQLIDQACHAVTNQPTSASATAPPAAATSFTGGGQQP